MATPNAPAQITPAQTQPQSEFSYTPPSQEGDPEFDQSVRDVIAEIEGEYNPPPDLGEVADQPPADQIVPSDDPDSGGQKQAATDGAEDPAVKRGFDQLVQREVALATRESRVSQIEQQNGQLQREITQLKASLPTQDLVEKFAHSPSEAIKALGHDPATIVRQLIVEDLQARKQPIPPELQKFAENSARDRRLASLEARETMRNREMQAQAEFNAISAGGHEYVKSPTGAEWKSTPLLADLAKSNPARAHQEIMGEILRDAQARMAADPGGKPMTYQEAAKQVEARLADWKSIFTPAAQPAGSPTTAPAQTTAQAPQAKKPAPPQSKPPAKPLAPWLQKGGTPEDLAIDEAIREFNRLEFARKAQR